MTPRPSIGPVKTRRGRRRPSSLTLVLLVTATVMAACGGPRTPIDVNIREVPSDILLGASDDPELAAPPAPPPSSVNPEPVGFPSFIQPPPPIPGSKTPPTTEPPPAVDPCPAADPLAAPAHVASRNIIGPPAEGVLDYRNDGRFEVTDGETTQRGTYPPQSQRTITREEGDGDGTFRFVVTEVVVAGTPVTTATTYFVDPASGVYLAGIATSQLDGSTDSFTPADPRSLPILPLPAGPNTEISGTGVDPVTRTAMTIAGRVVGKVKVDACGTPLDAWEVEISDGRITSLNKQLRFTASYAIGTQYGGLSLRDRVTVGCDDAVAVRCDNGRRIKTENLAIVSSEPALVEGATAAP